MGGSLICCPAGYYLNDERVCTNVGSPNLYTTTAQGAHLTVEASSPCGTATGASPASNNAAATGSATSRDTGSKTSGVASSTSKAAAANLDAGLGGLLAFVGGLLFL
ncbi:hypothetical protein NA56DRAFT_318181 [Hyaloscypha hepaticicola]|uniref:Uncharacterized protein n=1 Tax=Hyaloscypha hepaticicola TaxID=2082293 RepID=A0A2J6PQD0_9HELO|nr:hypothetical protein NA56DRAFT_318181 [Hyaloscypha hepaticicola]